MVNNTYEFLSRESERNTERLRQNSVMKPGMKTLAIHLWKLSATIRSEYTKLQAGRS